MASELTFHEHDSFHGEVLRGTLGAAAGGLLVGIALTLFRDAGAAAWLPYDGIWALLGLGLGVGFFGPDLKAKLKRGLIYAAAAAVPALLLRYLAFNYLLLALVLAGVGLGLVTTLFEQDKRRRLVGALLGVPALALGGFAAYRFGTYGIAQGLAPVPVITAVAGAVGGFVVMATGGLRRLGWLSDPVSRTFKKAEDVLRGELLKHANQAKRVYDQILEDLQKREVEKVLQHEIRDRSKELCLSLFETAMRWQAIQGDTAHKNEADLKKRIDELMVSAGKANDPVAREQYERAAKSLEEQLSYLQSIGRGRERTVARIVAQLALLEKVRFSLVNFHASDHERLADELRSVSKELDGLSSDVDIIGQALRETSGALPPAVEKETIPEVAAEADAAAEAVEAEVEAEALASKRS